MVLLDVTSTKLVITTFVIEMILVSLNGKIFQNSDRKSWSHQFGLVH